MTRILPSDTRPLLDETPHSYSSITQRDCDDVVSLASDSACELVPAPALNKFSRADTIWILAGLWSAVFLGALDGTVVATLLTPIGSHFNKSNQSSYIGTAYLLSVCRLSDILGRKGAMLLALSLFGSGTIFCGMAPSMEALIAARAVAGMGGGGIVVTDLIPLQVFPKQRGLYQGMANILFGLGAGIGGPLGGWINDAFGCFILVSVKVNIQLPYEVQNQTLYEKLRRIDGMGSLTLVGTVGCLLLGFSLKTTEEMPWSHPIIYGLFIASAVFGVFFILVEKYWSPYPVMPLRLITQRTPLSVSIANLFGSMAAFSMVNYLLVIPSCQLTRMNIKALQYPIGLHLLPHSVSKWVSPPRVMRRTGKLYTLTLASSAMTLVASVLILFWNDSSSTFHLWLDIVPQGFGMASLITSTLIAMIAGVYKEDMAVATGITYLFRTTGQVLGVSLSGAILQAILLHQLRVRIQGPGSAESSSSHSTAIIPTLEPRFFDAAVHSYADALRVVFICQAAWNFMAFLACLPIQENHLPGTAEEQEQHYRNQSNCETLDN
ncbi:MFS general substrate transporter [Armillaria borealis]|uniref:MFS general substrate transporter n=1 Tax=Armillaria borealis TaxID=47425 RepID=A0AA39N0X5_9AGAR|nr:MFS general substrate transporter [Armillaria borealis]